MAQLLFLLPLTVEAHRNELTRLYRSVPTFRALQGQTGLPYAQAEYDLVSAAAIPDRTLLGILRAADVSPTAGAELVGLIDFRRHWPQDGIATLGLILIAEPLQRQGLGSQAWELLEPWLIQQGGIRTVRAQVEQNNPGGLRFLQQLGFSLTGASTRVRRNDRLVRLLEMTKTLPP